MAYQVKVIASSLNIRNGPGTSYDIIGSITDKGVYTISSTNTEGTWGQLLSGGWISLGSSYVKKLEPTTDDNGNVYADGVFKRNINNNGWINYNDTNDVFMRNSANTGWVGGDAKYNYPTIYRRNSYNNGWIQIYPGGVVQGNEVIPLEGETKMANYRKDYGNWRYSYARQGWGIVRNSNGPAGGIQFGLIGLKYSKIEGGGNIVDPGTPRFGGGTGGSGNYNATQLVQFRGCKHTTWASGNPLSKHDSTGYFGYKWKSAGAYTKMPEADLMLNSNNGRSAFLRWANNTNGYGSWMCMYNGETNGKGSASSEYSANYLTIEKFSMKLYGYKYSAHRVASEEYGRAKTMVAMSLSNTKTTNCYIDAVVPSDKANLSLDNIIKGINNGDIPYIKPKDMMSYSDFDYKPCIMQQNDDVLVTSPIYNESDNVQYKFNDEWYDAISLSPRNFKILKNSNEARIINNLTGEVYFQMLLEWD